MISTQVKTKLKMNPMDFVSEKKSETTKILGIGEELKPGDYFQQGDCILAQLGDQNFVDAPTKITGEKVKSNLVLKGMTNSHALYEGDFDIYKDGDNIFVDVKTYTVLDHVRNADHTREHAEHHGQYIPKGKYFFRGVFETDHLEKLNRQVID